MIQNTFFRRLTRTIIILGLLYLFLTSISLLSTAFKLFGKPFAEKLIETTSNPFIGLFIGILATSIVQSSSTITSMVVGFVAAGTLSIRVAIPIVMGANIGTTVTNIFVALGHITRKEEFQRAFTCAVVHDFFNLITVFILFPLEMHFHFLEKTATILAIQFSNIGGFKMVSPVKTAVKPLVSFIKDIFLHHFNLSKAITATILVSLAVVLLIFSLFFLVKIMKSIIARRAEIVFDKTVGKHPIGAMIMGVLFTALIQSSSVTTSLLVPIGAAGILTAEQILPVTLGANVGTTFTAILASLTGNIYAITIAFAHLLFNITGILIIYPIKKIRRIPVILARRLGKYVAKKRWLAFVFVIVIFFLIPGCLIAISKLIK